MPAAAAAGLPIAVGLLAASLPVAVIVLMLVTRGTRGAVTAFLSGWFAGTAVVAALTVLVLDTTLPRPTRGGQGAPAGPPSPRRWRRWPSSWALTATRVITTRGRTNETITELKPSRASCSVAASSTYPV
ncbi:hypothetical protein [Kocuria sp. CPCC 205263]|uniref:hypothetical protein n=1 Tax=Kocuria sp. CPCC 205263 TaxID=3073555 RepID=UPI0034D5BE81